MWDEALGLFVISANVHGCERADLLQALRRSCLVGTLSAWIRCAFLLCRKIAGNLLCVSPANRLGGLGWELSACSLGLGHFGGSWRFSFKVTSGS